MITEKFRLTRAWFVVFMLTFVGVGPSCKEQASSLRSSVSDDAMRYFDEIETLRGTDQFQKLLAARLKGKPAEIGVINSTLVINGERLVISDAIVRRVNIDSASNFAGTLKDFLDHGRARTSRVTPVDLQLGIDFLSLVIKNNYHKKDFSSSEIYRAVNAVAVMEVVGHYNQELAEKAALGLLWNLFGSAADTFLINPGCRGLRLSCDEKIKAARSGLSVDRKWLDLKKPCLEVSRQPKRPKCDSELAEKAPDMTYPGDGPVCSSFMWKCGCEEDEDGTKSCNWIFDKVNEVSAYRVSVAAPGTTPNSSYTDDDLKKILCADVPEGCWQRRDKFNP